MAEVTASKERVKYIWVKVQNSLNWYFRNSNLKTCSMTMKKNNNFNFELKLKSNIKLIVNCLYIN